MTKRFWRIVAVLPVLLCASVARAQEVVGQWQGTLHATKQDLRTVIKVFKGDNGTLKADFFSIDQGATPIHVTTFVRDGSSIKFTINMIGGSYEGKLSADGKTINGSWSQGGSPLPLDLVLTTKETAWEIPAPPPPPKLMAADADPSFDVATIKPNNSGGTRMQQLTINNRQFRVRNGSLADLIGFAFNVQAKQIIGAPDWLEKDRYDIEGTPDTEGAPSDKQVRGMVRKLLIERFALKFHHETREMPAFVLTVAKSGSKLTPTEANGPLPGLGFHPATGGLGLIARNATPGDLCTLLQGLVLDRPVVDHTNLSGRFDIDVTFTPDDSQFGGHPPQLPKGADNAEPAPSLFEAMQQTLGLKLSPEKAQVDVVVLDHVEKPSAN